jgi:hypothetical protein
MTTAHDTQFIVGQLIQVTTKETRYLERTANRLRVQNIDLSWVELLENSDEHSEMLDAFVSRYGRLQDTLGDKLLPSMLRAGLEKTGSQLDNLLRAEKLGWIDSTQAWIELRELRNRLVHEYMESADDLLVALQQALQGVRILTETQFRMATYAQKSKLFANLLAKWREANPVCEFSVPGLMTQRTAEILTSCLNYRNPWITPPSWPHKCPQ